MYYPPNFITNMLNRLQVIVDDDSYDNPDQVVNKFLQGLTQAINGPHLGQITSRMSVLSTELKDVHGVGKNDTSLNLQIKKLYAHLLLLSLQANLSISASDITEDVLTCVAEDVITDSLFAITAPTRAVFEQLQSVYLMREMFIELFYLAIELQLEFDPFTECVRAYAELFHCQTCVPLDGVARAMPCKNTCMNVMIGCSAFYARFASFVRSSERQAKVLHDNAVSDEKSYHDALVSLVAEINKLYQINNGTTDVDAEQLVDKIRACLSSSRSKRESLSIKAVRSNRRFLRQLTGAVDSESERPTSHSGVPHSVTSNLYTAVFVDMQQTYFSKLEELSMKLANDECNHLPSSGCWNQQSLGADTGVVVRPGSEALSSNPNLRAKGDTDITNFNQAIEESEEKLEEINVRKNTLLGITASPDASVHTAVQGVVVVMATILTAILVQLL